MSNFIKKFAKKSCRIAKKALYLHQKLGRFSDKTVRNKR